MINPSFTQNLKLNKKNVNIVIMNIIKYNLNRPRAYAYAYRYLQQQFSMN